MAPWAAAACHNRNAGLNILDFDNFVGKEGVERGSAPFLLGTLLLRAGSSYPD
jgi:hypothetical protein